MLLDFSKHFLSNFSLAFMGALQTALLKLSRR
jgi:hypothetical protein